MTNKQHILVFVGISASGKSTKARYLCATKGYVRVNRDEIRKMLFGYTDADLSEYYTRAGIQYRESLVSAVQDKCIREALKAKKSVIVDNTNLKKKYLKEFSKYGVPVEYKTFDIDLPTAILRDQYRDANVGREVLERQYKSFQALQKDFFNN